MAGKKKKTAPKVKPKQSKIKGVRISEIPGEVRIERSPFKLKGNIQFMSTDIDSLRAYVLEKKTVKLSDAARKFNVPVSIIEDWGSILEDHHMIDMHYPVAGEPMLRVHEPKKSWKEKKAEREKLKALEKAKKEEMKSKGIKPVEPPKKKGPGMLSRFHFTKKRIFIMAQLIILAELLIYIFIVNPHLRSNFLPTLNYQITNLPHNLVNLPQNLSSLVSSMTGRQLLINPLYFVLAFVLLVFWIAIVIIQKRKKAKQPKPSEKK